VLTSLIASDLKVPVLMTVFSRITLQIIAIAVSVGADLLPSGIVELAVAGDCPGEATPSLAFGVCISKYPNQTYPDECYAMCLSECSGDPMCIGVTAIEQRQRGSNPGCLLHSSEGIPDDLDLCNPVRLSSKNACYIKDCMVDIDDMAGQCSTVTTQISNCTIMNTSPPAKPDPLHLQSETALQQQKDQRSLGVVTLIYLGALALSAAAVWAICRCKDKARQIYKARQLLQGQGQGSPNV